MSDEKIEEFSCSVCGMSFMTRSGLWKHSKNLHQDKADSSSKISCNLCTSEYVTVITLHLFVHSY